LPRAAGARAVLITHDCEIDKPGRRYLVCPVVPLARIPGGAHGDLRKNRIVSMLFLPAYRNIMVDSFISFNQITTVEPGSLDPTRRLVSLSDLGRSALYNQLIRWLTRWRLHTLICPQCKVEFDHRTLRASARRAGI
jgi:hypothetical protein